MTRRAFRPIALSLLVALVIGCGTSQGRRDARKTGVADPSDILNKPIADLELSIRARRTVETLGCLTVGDVLAHSDEELLGMPNFGQTSLAELKQKLAEMGLKLKSKNG